MEVTLNGQENTKFKLVHLAKEEKKRNYDSRRISGSQFNLDNYERLRNFDQDLRTPLKVFGLAWSTKVKGKKFAKPTIIEVITGLKNFIFTKLSLVTEDKADLALFKKQYTEVFDELIKKAVGNEGMRNE